MTEMVATDQAPGESPVAQAVRATLRSMTEAIVAVLGSETPDRFGTASRMCSMAQKLSIELVTTVKQAAQVRACGRADMALGGYLGPEAQYVAQAGFGEIGDVGDGVFPMQRHMGPVDTVTMQRDLMMMLQSHLEDQKKSREKSEAREELNARPHRLDAYAELHKVFAAIAALKKIDPDGTDLAILEKKERPSWIAS